MKCFSSGKRQFLCIIFNMQIKREDGIQDDAQVVNLSGRSDKRQDSNVWVASPIDTQKWYDSGAITISVS